MPLLRLHDPRSGKRLADPAKAFLSRGIFMSEREKALERILDNLEKAKRNPDIVAYTRNKHYVGLRPAAVSGATARSVAANLWNPHATSRVQFFEYWCFVTTAASITLSLARTTARGTASTSLAMAIANSIANDTAAPSGCVVDSAWSVAPTVSAADLVRATSPAAIGNGFILAMPDPIDISPAGGMAAITPVATAFPICDHTFVIGD